MNRKRVHAPLTSVDVSVDVCLDEFSTSDIIEYLIDLYETNSLDGGDMEDLRELAHTVLNGGIKNNLAYTLKMEIIEENIDRFSISELQDRLK